MYTVSALWGTLIADPEHYFITKVSINGTEYTQDKIFSMSVEQRMFTGSQPGVGGCLSGELKLRMLAPTATIPRMAEIIPYVCVTNGSQTSEWIPQGHYFIDTRETTKNDDNMPVIEFHAYDAMLKTEEAYPDTAGSFPKTDADVIDEVAATIGVGVDSRTYDLVTAGYMIGLPVGFSMREVLANIAAMYAGNWVMNYDGELLLIAVNGIPVETNYLVDAVGDAITFGTGTVQKSASGSIATFNDGSGMPLDSLSIGINPVQSGTGDPSPNNVRPISGFNTAIIHVSPTLDPGDGTTYTINLDGTRYGGTLDVLTGVLTVNMAGNRLTKMTGISTGAYPFVWGSTTTNGLPVPLNSNSLMCDTLRPRTNIYDTAELGFSAYVAANGIIRLRLPGITSVADADQWLADNATFVCFAVTPFTVQLTPQLVTTLVGENNIWTDTNGSTSLTYTTGGEVTRILV